jgi:hypothetical protein
LRCRCVADRLTVRSKALAPARRPDATPRFILAQDGKVILSVTGNAGWKDKMWPKILEVTETKA